MVSEKLIAFILKARQNKRSDDQIAQQLLSVGWKQEAITDAFSEIKSKKITAPAAAQAAKAAQAQQPAQTAPPWVKPAASAPATQPSAQATSAPVSSAPQQPSSAPVAQPAPAPSTAPAQQAPAGSPPPQIQAPPIIPTPQPTPQSPIPPVSPIQLPAQKKSLFSSLFGKKPFQPPAPTAQAATPQQQQAPAPQQAAAPGQQPAARLPIFPPRPPAQATLQPPTASTQPAAQGQSTLATFAGASAQQSATATVPSGTAPQLAQQPHPSAALQTPPAPQAQPQPPAAQAKPAAGIMKFLPVIALAIILAAAGAYYVFVMAPAGSAPPTPSQPIAPPVQNITPSAPTQKAAGPLDCGADMDCFIQASSACKPAKMVRISTTDFFGMLLLGTMYMEIQNTSETGKCSLYSLTLDSSVKLSDAMVAAALAKGVSIDDIKKQEAESTRQAKAAIGLNGTCKYGATELPAMLNRWKAGSFSNADYAGAECSGKLYSGLQPDGSFSANLTLQNITVGKANTTKANTTANASTASPGPANTTNKTGSTPPSAPKTNTTAATNTTIPASNASTAATFKYSHRYTTYYPERLVWFCTDRDTEFYRMHWKEYFGGDCSVVKPKEGYVNFSDYAATGCTMIPCCVNGPYNEYSRSYDYFECGYN